MSPVGNGAYRYFRVEICAMARRVSLTAQPMAGGSVLILVPPIFGLIYYVFDFGIARAMFLTLLAMAHSVSYLCSSSADLCPAPVGSVHAGSFFLFGMPLEILVIVSFYSWGMSRDA
jgi:hypothetical protein